MKLRQKILLLAIVPLIIALFAIALAVKYQASVLAVQQRASVEEAYLASKKVELSNYVTLATQSIAHLYEAGASGQETMHDAIAILSKLDYGDDGYFFLYDLKGKNLMHPRQPELVGKNLWEMKDAAGNSPIQLLVQKAKSGGGLVHYAWEKPSTGEVAPKLGFVVELKKWGWMLGTGLYLDDIASALEKTDNQISGNIQGTMVWIMGIAVASALVVALSGLALNISEHRIADAKLRELAQRVVRSQEDERARLSRDLHDGISQSLVSIKLQVESGIAKMAFDPKNIELARRPLDQAAQQLNNVLGEVRRISHDLRPALLDDLGIAAALDHLAQEFMESSAILTSFVATGIVESLSDVESTVLFRIAQESLTNIKRHAYANVVELHLIGERNAVKLIIRDNGLGFVVADVLQHPKRGIGLRNMHERASAVGGLLEIYSSAHGTHVTATLPRA